jgi:hydrogenase nickel incorporation protein HypA/HybF
LHEVSLIQNLFELIKQEKERKKAQKIVKIELEVGSFSGAEPLLLKQAFEILKKGTEFEEAELIIKQIKTKAKCFDCKKIFTPDIFPFECPFCGNFGGEIIEGKEIIIKRIEMEKGC